MQQRCALREKPCCFEALAARSRPARAFSQKRLTPRTPARLLLAAARGRWSACVEVQACIT